MWRQRFVLKSTWTLSTEIIGTVMSTVNSTSFVPVACKNCTETHFQQLKSPFKHFIPELKEIEDEEGNKGIYWQINFPFFMSNRDVSFCERLDIQRQITDINQIFFKKFLWILVDNSMGH